MSNYFYIIVFLFFHTKSLKAGMDSIKAYFNSDYHISGSWPVATIFIKSKFLQSEAIGSNHFSRNPPVSPLDSLLLMSNNL